MIIKSVSHSSRNANIRNLIAYVFSDKDMMNEQGESVTVKNLLSGSRSSWAKQFDRVEGRRKRSYGGKEVRLYHEILSWHPDSKPTKEELEAFMWKYLELRLGAPVYAFGAVHWSDSHYHAHLVLQGVDLYGKSIRKSKAEYRDIQIALNEFQERHYPHLGESFIDYRLPSNRKKEQESHPSFQRTMRTGEPSEKSMLAEIIGNVFVKSDSVEAFIANLAIKGAPVYYRNGKLTGVLFNNRKYRLKKTLGVDFEALLRPNLEQERRARLKKIAELKGKDQNKER